MALARPRVADFVKETTDTEGTGAISLGGPVSGFQGFSVLTDGAKVYYSIVDNPDAITAFEQGIGTYTAGSPGTVSRDRVIASSSGTAKISWAPGTKTIIVTAAAELLNSILDSVDSDLVTAGTSTAYTLVTYRPAVGLFEGRFICAKLHVANGATPTLNVDGAGAKAIVDINGIAPASGSMPASYFFFKYDATATKWVVFSPFNYLATSGGTVTGPLTMSGAVINEAQGANIASASTLNLDAATGNLVDVTGTTAITAVTLSQGRERTVRFTGALTLTNGASLVLPGGANITTAAGDFAVFRGYASSVVRCVSYMKSNGQPISLPSASTSSAGAVQLSTASQARGKYGSTALTADSLSDISFESAEIALTLGSSGSVAHGLGVKPKMVIAYIRCKTPEYGYSVGEELMFSTMIISGVPSAGGLMASALDATNLRYVVNAANLYLLNASGGQNTLTVANWRLVIRAWA